MANIAVNLGVMCT